MKKMTTISELTVWAKDIAEEHPSSKKQIFEFVESFIDLKTKTKKSLECLML